MRLSLRAHAFVRFQSDRIYDSPIHVDGCALAPGLSEHLQVFELSPWPGPDTFYLVYVNRSGANALKAPLAGLRRSMVERRAKGSFDENVRAVKLRVEK